MDRENEKWQACSNNKKKRGSYYEFTHRVSGAFTNDKHEMKRKKGKKKSYTREKNIKNALTVFSKYTHR